MFDGLEIVRQKESKIRDIISKIESHFDIFIEGTFVWKSRVTGKCKFYSDVDICLLVPSFFEITDLDMVNSYLRSNKMSRVDLLELDIRFVHSIPNIEHVNINDIGKPTIHIPQIDQLSGSDIFNLELNGKPVKQFMLSAPPHNLVAGYWHNFYRNSEKVISYEPRVEILFGNSEPHEFSHEAVGTQPFGSYLRGHINDKLDDDKLDNSIKGKYFIIQQYYKSNLMPGKSFFDIQVEMNYSLIHLFEVGLVPVNANIYFQNHSHDWDGYAYDPTYFMSTTDVVKLLSLPVNELKDIWRLIESNGIDCNNGMLINERIKEL